jgi:hypothetical protein
MADAPIFKILVIDECPAVHLFVDLAVGCDDVLVVRAVDGYTALACLARIRPDLVFADDALAGVAVPHLLEALRASGVPVLSPRPLEVPRLRELVARLDAATDPVETWMGTADASLTTAPGWWQRDAADAGFSSDVAQLRAGGLRDRLVVRASQYID